MHSAHSQELMDSFRSKPSIWMTHDKNLFTRCSFLHFSITAPLKLDPTWITCPVPPPKTSEVKWFHAFTPAANLLNYNYDTWPCLCGHQFILELISNIAGLRLCHGLTILSDLLICYEPLHSTVSLDWSLLMVLQGYLSQLCSDFVLQWAISAYLYLHPFILSSVTQLYSLYSLR